MSLGRSVRKALIWYLEETMVRQLTASRLLYIVLVASLQMVCNIWPSFSTFVKVCSIVSDILFLCSQLPRDVVLTVDNVLFDRFWYTTYTCHIDLCQVLSDGAHGRQRRGGGDAFPQHFGRRMQCLSCPLAATNLCQSSQITMSHSTECGLSFFLYEWWHLQAVT